MLKLLITVFIYGCLALNCNCYANINSERDSISREREVNDLYDGDINQVDDKRNYETPNDESWPRESDGGGKLESQRTYFMYYVYHVV